MTLSSLLQLSLTGGKGENRDVDDAVKNYEELHSGGWKRANQMQYMDMVNKYYDLATSFYEIGWGECFHFAHRLRGESLQDSIKRHEHYLALCGSFKEGDKVLDLGCGVGGPAREICRFSRASVTGVNNNAHQIARATQLTAASGRFVAGKCTFVQSDFMKLPFEGGSYDHAYAIEATCHAPNAAACYREIARCIKPGGMFVCYEWCLTDAFNEQNPEHVQMKQAIELGNGLPGIRRTGEIDTAIADAGLELLRSEDLVATSEVDWFFPIDPYVWRWEKVQTTNLGRRCSRTLAWCLECVGLAPKGTSQVSGFLEKGQEGLCDGGRSGIFTPMYLVVARKPVAGNGRE